jgi:hypothetical protein
MLILALFRLVSSAAGMMMPWLLNLATRMLARFLNMPEPLVHDTGILLFTHAQTIESSVGNTLCPIRLLRQLRCSKLCPGPCCIAGAARRRADLDHPPATRGKNHHDPTVPVPAPRPPG